jgi:hypothetical protein
MFVQPFFRHDITANDEKPATINRIAVNVAAIMQKDI